MRFLTILSMHDTGEEALLTLTISTFNINNLLPIKNVLVVHSVIQLQQTVHLVILKTFEVIRVVESSLFAKPAKNN